jgi:hypothetical protein
MVRASAVAICGALLLLAPVAQAQPQIVERLRIQGGYITEARPAPTERLQDLWVGAVPELIANWASPRALVSLSYSLTGALHSFGSASEIANRLVLTSAYELTNRTNLLLSAEGSQTSVSNFLIQRSPTDSPIALYPAAGTRFITGRLSQGLRHELTPVLQASQELSASVTTTLAPAPPLDTFTSGLSLGLERLWRNDGVGVNVRGGYAVTRAAPPTPSVEIYTATLAPHWRRDWTATLSTSLTAGGTYVFSPDPNREPTLAPFGQASALYTTGATSVDVNYGIGIFPSPLTGQILQSQQVVVHALTPLSEHHRVMIGGSVGVLRGRIIDLVDSTNDQAFDAMFTDVDVTWQASGRAQLFARYQFIAQLGDLNYLGVNPSFLRAAVIVGVQLSSEAVGLTVPSRFAQRVDGADAPLRTDRYANPPPAAGGPVGGAAEETDGEARPENETTAGGGAVEGMPGMWRTRPSRPAGETPQNTQQQRQNQQPNAPRGRPTR